MHARIRGGPRRGLMLLGLIAGTVTGLGGQAAPDRAPVAEVYDSYPVPGACAAAGTRALIRGMWGRITDTLVSDPGDPHDEVVQETVRRCIQRVLPAGVTVATVPDRDVATLFQVGRGLADDSLATAAWQRALTQQRIRDDSTSVLWQLDQSYAYGRPAHLPTAQRMARWLDTLGVRGERPILPGDSSWISQHGSPGDLARSVVDTAAMRAEVAGVRRNYYAMAPTARGGGQFSQVEAQAAELLLTLYRQPRADSAVAALKARAIEMFGPTPEDNWYYAVFGEALLLLGQTYGPIRPDYWFNRPAGDSIFPRPGRITLVQVVSPQVCTCEGLAATVHRLKARFGDSLDVLLLVQTRGHLDRRVQVPAAEEAAIIARRVREEWKVDATVAVYTTTFVPKPPPDNRLDAQAIPDLQRIRFGGSAMIVDRRGTLVMAGLLYLGPYSERALIRLIETQLRAPAN